MSLSELISSVAQPVLDLLPQVHARPASNEWGVADSWLGGVRTFKGPYLHVPATTHVEIYPKCEVPIDTGLQTLTTADMKTVAVNATTILSVFDPVLLRSVAGTEWQEYSSMRIRGIVCEVIAGHKWSQSIHQAAEFIAFDASSELLECGIEVHQVVLEDASETIPVRLFQ